MNLSTENLAGTEEILARRLVLRTDRFVQRAGLTLPRTLGISLSISIFQEEQIIGVVLIPYN